MSLCVLYLVVRIRQLKINIHVLNPAVIYFTISCASGFVFTDENNLAIQTTQIILSLRVLIIQAYFCMLNTLMNFNLVADDIFLYFILIFNIKFSNSGINNLV